MRDFVIVWWNYAFVTCPWAKNGRMKKMVHMPSDRVFGHIKTKTQQFGLIDGRNFDKMCKNFKKCKIAICRLSFKDREKLISDSCSA